MKKAAIFALMVALNCDLHAAPTPDELAISIINQFNPTAFNSLESDSEEEKIDAIARNAELKLKFILKSPAVSEELRICYVLKILNDRLDRSALWQPAAISELKNQRTILSKRLEEIQSKR